MPLVVEARDWDHGVFLGATISSEQTAAAEGTVGELRRDPFAMLPFCGYNMADHWQHWLDVGRTLRTSAKVPRVFQVNWFRTDEDGSFLWPGFGENARVLEWIMKRVDGQVGATETRSVTCPTTPASTSRASSPSTSGSCSRSIAMRGWPSRTTRRQFFGTFGEKVPDELYAQLETLRRSSRPATDLGDRRRDLWRAADPGFDPVPS